MLKLMLPKCFYIIGVSWLQNTDLQMKAYEWEVRLVAKKHYKPRQSHATVKQTSNMYLPGGMVS